MADPNRPAPAPGDDVQRDDGALLDALVARVCRGDVRAGARAMRLVDDRHPRATELLARLHPRGGHALVLGVTGNPGSGKSTLTDQLVAHYRAEGLRVGVVAVDPSSPFSGGAILGDRIRMNRHATDPGVFIRSVATRGHLGGLSRSTNDMVAVLDAMGYDVVIIETVGVGQDEIEVVRVAHTSVVVTVPGLGDDIQAIKAGLLEIADVFVVNKADREGSDHIARDIRGLQGLVSGRPGDAWTPPIVKTVATTGQGVPELAAAIAAHRAALTGAGLDRERARRREAHVLESLVRDRLERLVDRALTSDGPGYDALLDRLASRETDPYTEAERVLARVLDGEA